MQLNVAGVRQKAVDKPNPKRRSVYAAVPCRPLKELMVEAQLSTATFLSLDVKGAEDRLLATVDPALFSVIMVEADMRNRSKDRWVGAMGRS
eukprot:1635716-Prymnesium_polylepis.1